MKGLFALAVAATLMPALAMAGPTAKAVLKGPDGQEMGTVTLMQSPNGVLISAEVRGLAPGAHGFHIHERGACAPDFKAAGGHYNPYGSGHGLLDAGGYHAGDLPNIFAHADGTARADVFTDRVSLVAGAPGTLFDADGSAIIIHEKPDSYGAAAGAGGRVACGVIERE